MANRNSSYITGLDWYSYYTDADRGYNIVNPDTLAETATFHALREVAGDSNRSTSNSPPSTRFGE